MPNAKKIMTELSSITKAFLDKETTKGFLAIAESFVNIVENENISTEQFYKDSHQILLELYVAGHKLEQINLKYSNAETEFEERDTEFYKNQNELIISKLGMECFYWEVFDPNYSKEDEPTQGWLVDDFADIYRDLKTELEKMNIGTDESVEDALWQMKWSFLYHWGHHCINALRCLHYLPYDGKIAM